MQNATHHNLENNVFTASSCCAFSHLRGCVWECAYSWVCVQREREMEEWRREIGDEEEEEEEGCERGGGA